MNRSPFIVLLLLLQLLLGCSATTAPSNASSSTSAVAGIQARQAALAVRDQKRSQLSAPAQSRFPGVGFANKERLDEHFKKHGHEVGAHNSTEYLQMAVALRDAPVTNDLIEKTRPTDNKLCRFERKSGFFLVYNQQGTISTFFRPNDGERYFERQLKR